MFTLSPEECARRRDLMGLSCNEFARRAAVLGYVVSPETVKDVEKNIRRRSLDVAYTFCRVLQCALDDIVIEVDTVAA